MRLISYATCCLLFAGSTGAAEFVTTPPRLAVVLAVDQLRGDYLERFRPHFGPGGFRRLLDEGLVFEDCHYRFAVTKTAAGHATIATGAHADVHGVYDNEWLDRESWQVVASVEDAAHPLVGAAPGPRSPSGILEAKAGRSPRRLLESTVGDQLKLRQGATSRVIGIANKDRSAILLGGHLADAAYWVEQGRFISSTYYRSELPAWVQAFNGAQRAEAAFGQTWDRLLDASVYDAVQGADDAAGESDPGGLGRTFPKRLDGGATEITRRFYEAYENSPFSLELIGEFAEAAVEAEELGQRGATDLLWLGFSQLDTVGHSYGPDSHEVMDSMLRLDRVLARFLDFLDQKIGLAECVIVLTSDHGVSPLPERVQSLRPEILAGRFDGPALDRVVTAALDAAFGPPSDGLYWATRDNFSYHLLPANLDAKQLADADVARTLRDVLREQPLIPYAYSRADVLAASTDGDDMLARSRRSFHPQRGADVVFILAPYVVDKRPLGTNHGSPYHYDTHVPLVWFGAGVAAGSSHQRVGVDDLAPTLARLLGVPPPPRATGRALF